MRYDGGGEAREEVVCIWLMLLHPFEAFEALCAMLAGI